LVKNLRVKLRIAQEFVVSLMKRIRAGLGDHIDSGAWFRPCSAWKDLSES
jgi:hypothetical protein